MTVMLTGLLDGAVVMALALIATALLRRRAASLRHAILASAVAAALVMPVLELTLPPLPVMHREVAPAVLWNAAPPQVNSIIPARVELTPSERAADVPRLSWSALVIVIWALGAAVILGGLAAGLARLARLRARCTPAAGVWREMTDDVARACGMTRRIDVLQSDSASLLVTCGLRRPAILLPAGAAAWPHSRVRAVLLHELAHIRRRDAALQIAAELLRALHWFNPLAWAVCRRLRDESEFACDDAVLNGGIDATSYATDLFDVATQLSPHRARWAAAAAIVHPSTLERRIAAMLNRNRNRAPLGRRGWIAAVLVAVGIAVPLAAASVVTLVQTPLPDLPTRIVVTPAPTPLPPEPIVPAVVRQTPPPPSPPRRIVAVVQPQNNSLIKILVLDQHGGVVPGAKIAVTDTATGTIRPLLTSGVGGGSLHGLPGGQYEVAVSLPGFTTVYDRITLAPGGQLERTYRLPIGAMTEAVTISCPARATRWVLKGFPKRIWRVTMPVVSAQERPQAPVRVGGSVRVPQKRHDVKPVCPADLSETATITLSGRLGVDGAIHDLAPQRDVPASAMAAFESARAAVSQWTYSPARLNNVPIDVNITVVVTFTKQ